jgi:hypothetical protein
MKSLRRSLALNTPERSARLNGFLQYGGLVIIFFGIKLCVIGAYGNAIPYWDQWDAEADHLYRPYMNGSLRLLDLFAPHNEHRIFTTRILGLLLLFFNKTWNPIQQMVANALLHSIFLAYYILLLTRVVGRKFFPLLMLVGLFIFSLPFGFENILTGFQTQFYCVLLFGIASLWYATSREALSRGWWLGILFGWLSFFSLASGVLTFAAAAVVPVLFYITGVRRTRKELIAIAVLVISFGISYWLTPNLNGPQSPNAKSFEEFFNALTGQLSWPASNSFIWALARNLPSLVFTIQLLRERPAANDYRWFVLAVIALTVGQAMSIAYGRAADSFASRYLDLFMVGIMANFACLIILAKQFKSKPRVVAIVGSIVWAATFLTLIGNSANDNLPSALERKRLTGLMEEVNTKTFVITGNINDLKNKGRLGIPYPSEERLASLLSVPEIRAVLPYNIAPALPVHVKTSDSAFIPNGYFQTTPKRVDNTWGSYSARGNAATGKLSIQCDSTIPSGVIEFPVAGPLDDAIKIEIEQNGRQTPVEIKDNPGDWGIAHASVGKGPFAINLIDASPNGWVAVGAPYMVGRFDAFTAAILQNYQVFIVIGICLLLAGLVQSIVMANVLKKQEVNKLAKNATKK